MVRKIYENAIYLRKKQNARKVYQRSNNVLPIEVPGEGEEDINLDNETGEQTQQDGTGEQTQQDETDEQTQQDGTGEQTQQDGTDE